MRYPWANVLIGAALAVSLVTGFLTLTSNHSSYLADVHAASSLAVVVVFWWKAWNVRVGLRRWRRRPVSTLASLVLAAVLVGIVVTGVYWSNVGPYSLIGFSGMTWHAILAVPAAVLVVVHVLRRTYSLQRRYWADRRTFMRTAAAAVGGLVVWRLGEAVAPLLGLSAADRRFTGSYPAGDFTGNAFPRTIWLADRVPTLDETAWQLEVEGHVVRPVRLDYAEAQGYEDEVEATLDCTGGWHSTQRWRGVRLDRLFDQAGLSDDAASVTVRSATGYERRFSLGEARGYLLATHVSGERLSRGHGFPLRLVAPDKRGYDWVKWVTHLEVNDTSKWWQPPLPLQ